jgi:hypothetical protein
MQEALWMALPFVVALGAGVLSFIVVQARMETTLAREREELIVARSRLLHQRKVTQEKIRTAESEARRKALDEFLADVKVEERQYYRETESAQERQRCLVLQERICFRNIPLSQWIERELPVSTEPAPELEAASEHGPVAVFPGPKNRKLLS